MPGSRVWPLPLAELRSLRRGVRQREGLINQVFTEYEAISFCHWFKTSQTASRGFGYLARLGLSETSFGSSLCHGGNPQGKPQPGQGGARSQGPARMQRWLHFRETVEPLLQLYQDQPPTNANKFTS